MINYEKAYKTLAEMVRTGDTDRAEGFIEGFEFQMDEAEEDNEEPAAVIRIIETKDEAPVVEEVKEEPSVTEEVEKPKKTKGSSGIKSTLDDGKIRSLYEGGWSMNKIAQELSCSPQTVKNHIDAMGYIEVRPRGRKPLETNWEALG